jgi:hypothetical protein
MTIAVTAQQSFTGPFFPAKFLHSQTGGIFEHNVGCTTQHHPYPIDSGMQCSPHLAGATLDRQAKPTTA